MGEVLIQIWLEEMSKLLDKQVNVQNKLLQAHEKVRDENERKNDDRVKIFVGKGRTL